MLRRHLLAGSGIAFVLAGCAAGSGKVTPGQVIADVQAALQGGLNVLPGLAGAKPPVITQAQAAVLTADLQQAMQLLQSVGPNTPAQAAATRLAQVEGYLNAVLSVLYAAPVPPPYNLIVAAIAVIAPELEAYLATLNPTPPSAMVAKLAAKARSQGMTLEKARSVLSENRT